MSQPAYETLDVEDIPGGAEERQLQRHIASITAGMEPKTTLDSLNRYLDKHGPDIPNPGAKKQQHRSALLGAALHLPEEEYLAFRERFVRTPVTYSKIRRRK